ncbi:ribosomal-protein-alanine acetyltransferase [Salmonella enterica subsp. enterica]|uniref:Ribosomal-protein-alanine acetyltransferase n=1 Tax=Salmonella enterica I TaxID=59201 RepID=A0A379WB39_SALET|nr:ribosomal-protein-alanine acetyltransferase [Salmonella enterica subsp. enterica]
MFGYRSNVPKVRLTTDRLVVRLVHERDAWRLADYYAENRHFLNPGNRSVMKVIVILQDGRRVWE